MCNCTIPCCQITSASGKIELDNRAKIYTGTRVRVHTHIHSHARATMPMEMQTNFKQSSQFTVEMLLKKYKKGNKTEDYGKIGLKKNPNELAKLALKIKYKYKYRGL